MESIHKFLKEVLVMDTQRKAWIKTSGASRWAQNRLENNSKRASGETSITKVMGRLSLDKEDVATLLSITGVIEGCGNRGPKQISFIS